MAVTVFSQTVINIWVGFLSRPLLSDNKTRHNPKRKQMVAGTQPLRKSDFSRIFSLLKSPIALLLPCLTYHPIDQCNTVKQSTHIVSIPRLYSV